MKAKNTRESLQAHAFRYGGYATLLVGIVIILVIAVNILARKIPVRVDLSVEKFYTLSAETLKVLDGLKKPVTIYGLFEPGKENPLTDELLKKYQTRTTMLSLKYADPYRSPALLQKYTVQGQPPGEASFIVESGVKFKVIQDSDLYDWDASQSSQQEVQNFAAEQAFTSAIMHVTAQRDPVVYLLLGHREPDLPTLLAQQMQRSNYILKQVNLTTESGVPADADILVALSPQTDITVADAQKIRSFLLDRGGRAVFAVDLRKEKFPNLLGVLESYGVSLEPFLVVEGDTNHYVPGEPAALVPFLVEHGITKPVKEDDIPIYFPYSQVITSAAIHRRTIDIQPLLLTSEKAWGQVNWETGATVRSSGDVSGPFAVAVAVTDKGEKGQPESRIVILGSSYFLFPPADVGQLPENNVFFVNCLSWLYGREDIITIRAKSISGIRYRLHMTDFQFYLFAAISIIAVPGFVLACGFILWLRRRHL